MEFIAPSLPQTASVFVFTGNEVPARITAMLSGSWQSFSLMRKLERQANRLGIILAKKNQVEYEERMFSQAEAVSLAKQVERLFGWVASKMGKGT